MTVVRLAALVDGDGQHFNVEQIACLADGRRIVFDDTHGWSGTPSPHLTRADIERDVRNVLLPDEDDGEARPWAWIAERLLEHGIEITPDELKRLPFEIELSSSLRG
jgi:hypothetical protein